MSEFKIYFEALAYNLPIIQTYTIDGYILLPVEVSENIAEKVLPPKEPLQFNWSFARCFYQNHKGKTTYTKVRNKDPIIYECEDLWSETEQNNVQKIVDNKIERFNNMLLLITNMHIFFPTVKTMVLSKSGERVCEFVKSDTCVNFGNWKEERKRVGIGDRIKLHLDELTFYDFIEDKNLTRYKNALKYYISSFGESKKEMAFCLHCAAIDAITSTSKSGTTKKRMAKYTSVLLCLPEESTEIEERLGYYYKLRSGFVHGKWPQITEEQEFDLRECVRKFLIAYYIFWLVLGVKTEEQFLQKLDAIYENHALYVTEASVAYGIMRTLYIDDETEGGILSLSMLECFKALSEKLKEALKQQELIDK